MEFNGENRTHHSIDLLSCSLSTPFPLFSCASKFLMMEEEIHERFCVFRVNPNPDQGGMCSFRRNSRWTKPARIWHRQDRGWSVMRDSHYSWLKTLFIGGWVPFRRNSRLTKPAPIWQRQDRGRSDKSWLIPTPLRSGVESHSEETPD